MGLVLYLVALLLDALPMAVRYWLGARWWGHEAGLVLAFGPLTLSLSSLVGVPSGGRLTRWELGGRLPSLRERELIDAARELLVHDGVRWPRRIFVLDGPLVNAYAVGTTLYVERGLLHTPDLVPVLAHELGHLGTLDARLVHAARRLVFPGLLFLARWLLAIGQHELGIDPATGEQVVPRRHKLSGCGCVAVYLSLAAGFVGGGLGLLLLRPAWRTYWRQREYRADAYAVALGQGPALAEALERTLLLDLATPYALADDHPPTELRIDRVLRAVQGEPPTRPEVGEYAKLVIFLLVGLLAALPMWFCLGVWYVLTHPRPAA